MDTLEFHYQILELSRQATPQEIKASYRRLIKQWHPDQFVGDPNTAEIAEEKVKQINLAYDAITASQHKFGTVASRGSCSEVRSPKASIQTTHLDPISLYQQASEQVNQGDYRSATESLSIAIKLEPNYAEAYRYRGFIYSLLGYERRAKSDLKKAAALKLQASMQFQTEEAPTSSPSPKQSPPVQNSYSTRSPSKSMPNSTEEQGEGQILIGHQDAITGLARHRKTLASCSCDGQIHLWNLNTQTRFCTLSEGRSPFRSVAFSQDGQLLVSGDEDGTVRLWHVPTGSLLRSLPGQNGAVRSLIIHQPQGLLIAGTETGMITVWDLRKGQPIQTLTSSFIPINAMQYIPKMTQLIAGCGDGVIRTWDLSKKYSYKRFSVQATAIHSLVITPDFRRVLLAGSGGTICTWSTVTEEAGPAIESNQGAVNTLAMNNNCSILATGGENGSIKLWNLANGTLRTELSGHSGAVMTSLFFESQLVTGGIDGTIRLWAVLGD